MLCMEKFIELYIKLSLRYKNKNIFVDIMRIFHANVSD